MMLRYRDVEFVPCAFSIGRAIVGHQITPAGVPFYGDSPTHLIAKLLQALIGNALSLQFFAIDDQAFAMNLHVVTGNGNGIGKCLLHCAIHTILEH
jgi:hypothetical protein